MTASGRIRRHLGAQPSPFHFLKKSSYLNLQFQALAIVSLHHHTPFGSAPAAAHAVATQPWCIPVQSDTQKVCVCPHPVLAGSVFEF